MMIVSRWRSYLLFVLVAAMTACAGNLTSTPASIGSSRSASTFMHGMAPAPAETQLYSFQGSPNDGFAPEGAMIADKSGDYYGVTYFGGSSGLCPSGCGTVFKLTPSGGSFTESIIYNLAGGTDGGNPIAGLVADKMGALYGTTFYGGGTSCSSGLGCGTVFKLTPSGNAYTESVLYAFSGGSDGSQPQGGLIVDSTGAVFGTTTSGGSGAGVVFKLTPSGKTYTESVIHTFAGHPSDGAQPFATLLAGKKGVLYGTTEQGGTSNFGSVFQLTPSGNTYKETILYVFKGGTGDVQGPQSSLTAGKKGVFFGTGSGAGSNSVGGVFELTPSGKTYTEKVIYNFKNGNDGAYPSYSTVVIDKKGNLYGTTQEGGGAGAGTVWKLAPSGKSFTETVLYAFQGDPDGFHPMGGMIQAKSGELYGTTALGGSTNSGSVFEIAP